MSHPSVDPKKSEPPEASSDLQQQRDQFLSTLGVGARVGEEMLAEHRRLLAVVTELREENARLRAAMQSESAVTKLLSLVEHLEQDKRDLLSRNQSVEQTFTRFNDQILEIETELGNVGNLYVACSQMFGSTSPRGVMRHVKEVLAQLVGAERYAIYLVSNDRTELVPVASEGVGGDQLVNHPADRGAVGDAFRNGTMVLAENTDTSEGTIDQPAALVPLRVDDRTVGVVVVYSTLPQKKSFSLVDHELFNLLGRQAVWALAAACLFAAADRRLPGLEAFVDLSV